MVGLEQVNKPGRLKLSGLQIFSNEEFNSSTSTVTQNKGYGTERDYGLQIESNAASAIPSRLSVAKKLSDWGVDGMNDYSPTLVNGSEFGDEEFTKADQIVPMSQIFRHLPGKSRRFVDEFQHAIIACDMLAERANVSFPWAPASSGSGVTSLTTFRDSLEHFTPYGTITLYGRRKIVFKRTIEFIPTMLRCYRCMRALSRLPMSLRRKTIKLITTIAICAYLATQQELIYSSAIRSSSLANLRTTLTHLQEISKQRSRCRNIHKDLITYRELSVVRRRQSSECVTPGQFSEVFNAAQDLLFFNLHTAVITILPVIPLQELSECCRIYGINLSSLFDICRESVDIGSKVSKCEILERFLLCCLLSSSATVSFRAQYSQEASIVFGRIFPNICMGQNVSDAERCKIVTKILAHLNHVLPAVITSLGNLMTSFSSRRSDMSGLSRDVCSKSDDAQTLMSLRKLQKIERLLLASEKIDEDLERAVLEGLRDLTKVWEKSPSRQQYAGRSIIRNEKRLNSLQLSVLSPEGPSQTFQNENPSQESLVKLNTPPYFTTVDDTDSIWDRSSVSMYNNQNSTHGIHHADGVNAASRQDFGHLTDDQLRNKLDNRIQKLAMENKRGKRQLRTQKSFELLNNSRIDRPSKQHTLKSRPFLPNECVSEESIPVIFELTELLERS
ncbi:LAMI_0E02410g1_1 [Lachancea mirantina]|uniref:Inheritance of peroxisomes protein 2 n=1 Tax=Lachancea mirantina TaxID=1230905 RepID=A0A1G4JJ38_9SACH|nr:LAMI_0E02410g1_1 [Lachancea mirantina]